MLPTRPTLDPLRRLPPTRRPANASKSRTARSLFGLVAVLTATVLAACGGSADEPAATAEEARQFVEQAEQRLLEAMVETSRADWEMSTNITEATTQASAEANERLIATQVELAGRASELAQQGLDLDDETARKLRLLRTLPELPAPADPALSAELAQIAARLQSAYGSGRWCPEGAATGEDGEAGECLELEDLEQVIDNSRDPDELRRAWEGWRTVSPAMRADYERYVELANQGAVDLGYADLGELWRSKYDMTPAEFAAEVDRLWQQVSPLYESLHCHVRAVLGEKYGAEVVPQDGPIPAHLLGNMWAQTWSNIYDLVAPPSAPKGYDLTEALRAKGVDEVEMVRIGERFFTSIGLEPLPETFWERSMFTKPTDRDVVCHASAWQVDLDHDLRIKMCIEINAEDFSTVHHELGHNVYQAAYRHLDPLFRDSANSGFHEALGDTVALSVTPAYLREIDLIDVVPPPEADLSLLMRMALDKVAFLPFGLLLDQWRWKVFAGEITPDTYNDGWWQLRRDLQGVAPPSERGSELFDPGAKYHIPANVSYTRYFLAHILQFQLHRDLCAAIGHEGPLNRCSIYGNQEAGDRLEAMMSLGTSRPWPEALATISEGGAMDATAILDYFAPLKQWLDEQNQGRTCGW
ncbi:MAG: peptidase M2 family protein [Acidobacteria bacterium]|nr:MAG: peptidase M2 family protein [Acidobacteriota bacterium]REK11288.1 MAG: peptidase M2 family protein [Acidobacteriota bacterium]